MNASIAALARYERVLRSLPARGGGCHPALLGAANIGAALGLGRMQVFDDLRRARPEANVPNREIKDAVEKAFDERETRHFPGEVELWERSPTRLDWPVAEDARQLLARLYAPDEIVYIGELSRGVLRKAGELATGFDRECHHIIPNPLTGSYGPKKGGGFSLRADSCVKAFRFAVVEFDKRTRAWQTDFWLRAIDAGTPVAAIIDSGGKSLHSWLRVHCRDAVEWETRVEQGLFSGKLAGLGADVSCKNEARLSRLPGALRRETGRWQRLLYLDSTIASSAMETAA
jgi:hypothetical protein